jgi:hypothetical protein
MAALGYYAQPDSWNAIGYDGPWLGRVTAASEFEHEGTVPLSDVQRLLGAR